MSSGSALEAVDSAPLEEFSESCAVHFCDVHAPEPKITFRVLVREKRDFSTPFTALLHRSEGRKKS